MTEKQYNSIVEVNPGAHNPTQANIGAVLGGVNQGDTSKGGGEHPPSTKTNQPRKETEKEGNKGNPNQGNTTTVEKPEPQPNK